MKSLHLATALTLASLPLAAHARHQAPKTAEGVMRIHRIEKLAEGAYCIFGQGGNIGLIVTDKHAVLIDDQFERIAPGLLATIKSVTDKPIKYLVNTHFHGDHTGANVVLDKQVTAIVAHTNVRSRMKAEQAKLEPAKQGGLPELALGDPDPQSRARLNIHLDNTEIHLLHLAPGHTDGDVIVGIPALRFIHMGDTLFIGMLPFIDTEGGGSFDGLVSQIEIVASFLPGRCQGDPGPRTRLRAEGSHPVPELPPGGPGSRRGQSQEEPQGTGGLLRHQALGRLEAQPPVRHLGNPVRGRQRRGLGAGQEALRRPPKPPP